MKVILKTTHGLIGKILTQQIAHDDLAACLKHKVLNSLVASSHSLNIFEKIMIIKKWRYELFRTLCNK